MDTTSTSLAPKFDALDPAVIADPYPTYARLRAAEPVYRGGPGTFMVLRYADVSALLRDPRLANKRAGEDSTMFGAGPAGSLSARIIASREGPEHAALRQALVRSLSAARSRRWRPHVDDLVGGMIAPALDGAALDVVSQLAFPLQAMLVCDLLGLPREDRGQIWPTAVTLGRAFIPYRVPTPQQAADADAAVRGLRDYLRPWLSRRLASPGEDLLSHMAAAIGTGGLERDDVLDNVVFLLFAGFEPTMNMVANGIAALLAHPGEFDRVRTDPTLRDSAVEEFLRYDAPTQYTMRIVNSTVDVGGRTIRPGRLLLLVLGSANRDPERFADPERLDVGRHPNPHLSFGGGTHHCTGWALARTIGEAVLGRLAARCRAIEPAGPPVRLDHPNFRAHESLPVRLLPA